MYIYIYILNGVYKPSNITVRPDIVGFDHDFAQFMQIRYMIPLFSMACMLIADLG